MKQVVFLVGVVLLFASAASAQVSSNSTSMSATSAVSAESDASTSAPLLFASGLGGSAPTRITTAEPWSIGPTSLALTEPAAADPQVVQSVFQNFNWQAYAGYTFVRFYQTPGVTLSTNGLNFGIVYYFKDWVGADGEFVATFGSQFGQSSKFLLGMGGLRFRWSAPRGLELWAHGLLGGSHYLPQTANGGQGALGYELGGGVDVNAHHQRWAYRFAVDMVGTQYFNTYQFSPKASAGIVFKF